MHVRKCFRENTIGFKNLCHCCFPSATWPFLSPPSLECFQPKLPLLSWSVPSDVQFSLRVYDWHGACLCPEMLGSSVMWWVYIFKNNPHSSDFEPNSNLKFFAVDDDDDYMYFFFSSAVHCYENHYCRISFLWIFFLCSTCCTETFRSKIPTLSSPAEILWALLSYYSFPIKVAVIENRHGTTHCLNTVDHRRWSQETHPVEKNKRCRSAGSSSHPHQASRVAIR